MTEIFAAILAIEGWRGPGTVGEAGEIGPYQITLVYWMDARMEYGTHKECENSEYAREVMKRYWKRYCPKALDEGNVEILAGVHHWGPKGNMRRVRKGDSYVARVLALVEEKKGRA